MSAGTFSVSRRVWSHPAFAPSEFSEREAFLWLVSEASWKDRTARAGRVVVDLKRGQLCASVRFMAEAWQWSKSRVDRFLKRLENRDMIQTESGTGQVVITLCNYDEYQGQRDTSGTEAGQSAGHERDRGGTNYKKDEIRIKKEEEVIEKRAKPETARMVDGWVPDESGYQHALSRGLTEQEITGLIHDFQGYWAERSDAKARKTERGWAAAWRNNCDNAAPRIIRARQAAGNADRGQGFARPASGGSMAEVFMAVGAARSRRAGEGSGGGGGFDGSM